MSQTYIQYLNIMVHSDQTQWLGHMDDSSIQQRAVETLEELGLREYEAKCFVALTEMSAGTAREVSECIDVPRTRVYEAVRVLESKGLVEIQHSSPQQFRAVAPNEAVALLQQRYQSRIETLDGLLDDIRARGERDESDPDQEVWSLDDGEAIDTRTASLLESAQDEALLFVGDPQVLSDDLCRSLESTRDRDIDFAVGAGTEAVESDLRDIVPESSLFIPELPLFERSDGSRLGRLVVVDDGRVLASTLCGDGSGMHEQAVFGDGVDNGLVVMARRLLDAELAD